VEVTVNGRVSARGGDGVQDPDRAGGAGSGGGVRIVAPVAEIAGTLNARGGIVVGGSRGGDGRIRIDTLDRRGISFINIFGLFSVSANMRVFPSPVPRLDILEAASQLIPEGHPSSVDVTLPGGASTNQTVRIQGRNFQGLVPLDVVVTPENGSSVIYHITIDMGTNQVAQTNVSVVIPVNTITRINVWTQSPP
jgi:hypothetical protein